MSNKPKGTSALREAAASASASATDQAPMNEFRDKINRLHQQILAMEPELAKMLPAGVDPGGFAGSIWGAVLANTKLVDADRSTLFVAARRAAQDGLIPDGREAVFSIYSTNVGTRESPRWIQAVQYMPMVEGIVKTLYASGEVTLVDGVAVYESELKSGLFKYRRGDSPVLEHEPDILSDDPGPIVAAYAVIKLRNGETKREVMAKRDLDKVRAASKQGNSGPWINWPDQMCIKAVLHRVRKQLPRTPRLEALERVLQSDLDATGFAAATAAEQQPAPRAISYAPGQTMDDIIGQQQQREPEPAPATQPPKQQGASRAAAASTNGQPNEPAASVAPTTQPLAKGNLPTPESMSAECIRNADDSKSETDLELSYDILRQIPSGAHHAAAVAAIKRSEARIFSRPAGEPGPADDPDEIS